MANGRVFTVTYWAPVSTGHCNETESSDVSHHLLTQWHSVSDVPDVWVSPVELLVNAVRNNTDCCHDNKQAFSVLPHTLPAMCRNVHLHHWDKVMYGKVE